MPPPCPDDQWPKVTCYLALTEGAPDSVLTLRPSLTWPLYQFWDLCQECIIHFLSTSTAHFHQRLSLVLSLYLTQMIVGMLKVQAYAFSRVPLCQACCLNRKYSSIPPLGFEFPHYLNDAVRPHFTKDLEETDTVFETGGFCGKYSYYSPHLRDPRLSTSILKVLRP
jgi:hypothetical protein